MEIRKDISVGSKCMYELSDVKFRKRRFHGKGDLARR